MEETRAPDHDVIIIGGGIAGLTCAVGLRGSGARVLLLEGDDALGGRARSWTDRVTGDPVHIGPHIFLSEYPNFLKLLETVGTRERVVWQHGRFITVFDGPTAIIELDMSRLPAPFHFAPSVARDKSMPAADKLSNLPAMFFALQLTEEDVLRLDGINAEALLLSLGVTRRYMERFWRFTSMAIMNVPLELCSAGALFRFYGRFIGQRGFSVGFPDGGLGDVFAPAAKAMLEKDGGEVRLGARVKRILGDRARATGVELADGGRIQARVVVAAIPPQDLQRIAPPGWRAEHDVFAELAAFRPCPYVSVFLWFDRKLTDLRFWARRYRPRDLNCDFYDLSNIHTGWKERPSLIASNIIYSHRADDLSDEEIEARTVREIAETFPGAARARVLHRVINRIPMAIHCPFPGTERRRPEQRGPIEGLILAGDWVKTGLPSSMESAARSGWRAAEEVHTSLRRPAPPLAVEHPPSPGLPALMRGASGVFPLKQLPMWLHGLR